MWSNDLCEELIVEIFTRLPVKSLLRFRSVSKWLYDCIGRTSFIRLHALRSPNKVMIRQQVRYKGEPYCKNMYTLHSGSQLSHNPSNNIEAVEYPFPTLEIIGSCNGMLCIYGYGKGTYLFNPSIRRKVTIHDNPSWAHCENQFLTLGFGFDSVIDDYKILKIAITRTEKGDVRSASVYTIKTGTWHEIAFPTSSFTCDKSPQCLFNGSLHWLVIRYLTDSYDEDFSYVYILKFDLSSEVFSRIELPEPSWKTNQVTVIKGCLAVVSLKHDDSWIWMRKECNGSDTVVSSWFVAFKLNTHEFEGANNIFQLNANENLLVNPFYNGVIVYNPETRKRSKYVGLSGSMKTLYMTLCGESLELLHLGIPCDQGKKRSYTVEFM